MNSVKIWRKVAKNSEISKDTKVEQIFHEFSKLEIMALSAKYNSKFEQAAFQNFSQSVLDFFLNRIALNFWCVVVFK